MASQPGVFNVQEFTDLGALAVGGRLYTYSFGTTTQKTAYTDAAGLVPHTYTSDGIGGLYIALNARGELPAPLYLASGSYDLAQKTAAAATVWTRRADPVGGSQVFGTYQQYGCAVDGLTDDTVAANAAHAALNAGTITTLLLTGQMVVSGALTTITKPGVAILGLGRRTSIIKQSGNTDTLAFQSTSPSTLTIWDITLAGFSIEVTKVNPSAGLALRLTRVIRANFDIEIRGCFQGVKIEGGYEHQWKQPSVLSSSTWSVLATGSYLFKIATDPYGNNDVPAEIFITTPNIKGAGTYQAGNEYLQYAMWVQCCDGVFISGGHIGFAYTAGLYLNPQNNIAQGLQNFEATGVYFDGNGNGDPTAGGVVMDGSATPFVGRIKLLGGDLKNWDGAGIICSNTGNKESQVLGMQISENGRQGISWSGGTGHVISSNTISGNNVSNGGYDAADITNTTNILIQGNNFLGGSNTHPIGLSVDATNTNARVGPNAYVNNTLNYSLDITNAVSREFDRGSFTASATGFTTTPTCTIRWFLEGNVVTLEVLGGISATSNATTFTLTGLPAALWPVTNKNFMVRVGDNSGAFAAGLMTLTSAGVLTFFKDMAGSAFTNAGTKTLGAFQGVYSLF